MSPSIVQAIRDRFTRPAVPPLPANLQAKTGPDRTLIDPESTYVRITSDDFAAAGPANTGVDWGPDLRRARFNTKGDHVYVSRLNGNGNWSVKLGSYANPAIKLREGMVLHRNFNWIELYEVDNTTGQVGGFGYPNEFPFLQPTYLELYVSTGPLVLNPGRKHRGLTGSTYGKIDCVATPARRMIAADFDDPAPAISWHLWGRDGAWLFLRNSDTFNTLIISSTKSQFLAGQIPVDIWRLYPGEVFSAPLDGQIAWPDLVTALGPSLAPMGLQVYCAAGQCKYDFMITNRDDVVTAGASKEQP